MITANSGTCVSVLSMLLTEDEYFEGPEANNAVKCLKLNELSGEQNPYKVHIAFEDVGCSIKSNEGSKTILANVTGEIYPGRLTAVLGKLFDCIIGTSYLLHMFRPVRFWENYIRLLLNGKRSSLLLPSAWDYLFKWISKQFRVIFR